MRWFVIGIIFATVTLPCAAAKRASVEQLEQMLTTDSKAHKSDAEIAKHLAGVESKGRISPETFARLNGYLRSDPLASIALRVLADKSQFLDLPESEMADRAVPDSAEQARLLGAARDFASQTLPGLPNFLATRTINLYDDTPHALKKGNWPTRTGLHLVGTSQAEITVRRERENQPPTQGSAVFESKIGLVSGGEFGTTLGMILTDMANGKVSWSHWEKTQAGLVGVFHYSVPTSSSHFELISSFQREASVEGFSASTGGRVAGIGVRQNVNSNNVGVERTKAAYHGSIWIDSASGTIERVTLEADTESGMPFRNAAILVDYGPVAIAGSTYICPVRSLALSEALANAETLTSGAPTEWMNETVFTNYHRFGSSARIVEEAANAQGQDAATTGGNDAQAAAVPQSSAQPAATEQPANVATNAPLIGAASAPEPAKPAEKPGESSANGTPVAETTGEAAGSKEDTAAMAQPAIGSAPDGDTQSGFTLHVSVNSLLVPAVVVDKSGKAVPGLGKEDFEVMDGHKRMAITGLTVVRSATSADVHTDEAAATEAPASNADAGAAMNVLRSGKRFVVFLFDDRHMTVDDLPRVQKAALRLFQEPLAKTDYADVLSLMGVSSGVTRDSDVLQQAVNKLTVHQAFQHAKEDCPDVDYYAADQIIRRHDPMAFQIAVDKAKQCSAIQFGPSSSSSSNIYQGMDNPTDSFQRAAQAAAARSLAVGDEDARESLLGVENVVRAMAKLPGQRILILVSPGFLTLAPSTMALKSEIMDLAAQSDVIVNTLDARGLYAGNVSASEGGNESTLGMMSGQQVRNKLDSMQSSEDAMAELADGTGGKFFHNNNDLQGGLKALSAAPENLYLLEVSLKDVKSNGTYHPLRVKVDRSGVEVTARKGFMAPKDK